MCLQKSMASGRWRTNRRRSHSSTPDWQPPGRGSPVAVRLRGRSAAPAAARAATAGALGQSSADRCRRKENRNAPVDNADIAPTHRHPR
jgi:hypothetical protein